MRIPKRLLPSRVVIETYLGTGGYGDFYADPVELPARIKYENKMIRNSKGAEVVSGSQLMLGPEALDVAKLGSKVALPYDDTVRKIESGGPVMGMRGVSHIQVDLQ